jgi:hypothetical protein
MIVCSTGALGQHAAKPIMGETVLLSLELRVPSLLRVDAFLFAARDFRPGFERPRGGSLSSAILYVAIVAIWACVLIPRWLRRDSARPSSGTAPEAVPSHVADGDAAPDPAGFDEWDERRTRAGRRPDTAVPVARDQGMAEGPPEADDAPSPRTPEESRQRMLAARRRLLITLLALEIAACALVLLRTAAVWVAVPPSVMLFGYLMLLREAARADAERARREEEAAYAPARARARARARAAQRAAASPRTVAPPAPPAAPRPDEFQDLGHGRDFAPGLAGKYTTSNTEAIDASAEDEGYYDQYQHRLRAVGD